MNILVTGASGFLGSRLVEVLQKKEHTVKAMVRESSDRTQLEKLGVEICTADLAVKSSLEGIMDGIDVVIHAGAATFGTFEEQKQGTIEGTRYMLDLAEAAGVKQFVHISSLTVYDINNVPKNALINESYPVEPYPEKVGPYAYTKTLSENMVRERMNKSDMPINIVRPGLIYGSRRNMFFPHLGFSAGGGKLIVTIGWEKKNLPLTYIYNTCEVIARLIGFERGFGKIYNIVDPKTITYNEYLQYYLRAMRMKSIVVPLPYTLLKLAAFGFETLNKIPPFKGKFGLSRYRLNPKFKKVRFDGSLVLKELDWYPEVSLDESLHRAFHVDE